MRVKNILFILGLAVFLYPTISDWWNSFHQSLVISRYEEKLSSFGQDEYEKYWDEAVEYNQAIGENGFFSHFSEKEKQEYEAVLSIQEDGLMGYLVIPAIECRLPIYHGTENAVLQKGIGHMEGTSLPVGGEGSHCVLSGHRGLPSASLFTNLDQLKQGDLFQICILKEELYYEVNQIRTVLPEDTKTLKIEEGEDLCTLVTCTPYGINTHRLLVSGKRIDKKDASEEDGGDRNRLDQNGEGGVRMEWKKLAKWTVLCLFIVLFCLTSVKEVGAEQAEGEHGWTEQARTEQEYEIKIQYEFSGVEFKLYEINPDTRSEVLIDRQRTEEDGELFFKGIKAGEYLVTGEEHEWKGECFLPVASRLKIPKEGEMFGRQMIIRPKYEKLSSSEQEEETEEPEGTEESDKTEETGKEETNEDRDPFIPKTGQLWMPVWILLFGGLILLLIVLILFFW